MALSIPLLLTSCNDEEYTTIDNKCRVVCSVDKFESESLSRTNTEPENGFLITWASGDVIGIFPREGYQEPFEIPADQVGNKSASFDGGYWDVKDGLQYNAYYPFDKRNFDSAEMKTKIPVTYEGQKQNGTSCDIGAFDYTYSDWGTAVDGKIGFDFHHIGAIAAFSLEYPATTTYTQMTLSVDDALIPLEGSYDLTATDVSFVADESSKAKSITLALENCSGVAGETGVFYMMLPPMDLSNNEVILTLRSSAGTTCTYSINKTLNAKKGKLYRRTGVPIRSNVEGTIDGWCEETSRYADGVAYVAKAGELSSIIPENEKYTITSLKVFGKLNGSDIRFIREMAGSDVDGEYTEGKLEMLDITKCDIVEGGDSYIFSYMTINNNISSCMFQNCSSLKSIFLPETIVEIAEYAFLNCTQLYTIDIPQQVSILGTEIFEGCTSIEELTIPGNIETWNKIGNCSVRKVIIENGVTYIPSWALALSNLKEIIIPKSVSYIGSYAFGFYNESIESVYVDDLEQWLSYNWGSSSHVPFSLNGGTLYINGEKIKEVTIPNSYTSIPKSAFEGCSNIESVILPNSIINIEESAFANSGIRSIVIPNSVRSIGEYAFAACNNLENVKLSNVITNIPEGCFSHCEKLEFTIPNNIKTIETHAFVNCKSIVEITIPDGITKLDGSGCFDGCINAKVITLPISLEYIGSAVFANIPIDTIYCHASTPPQLSPYGYSEMNFNSVNGDLAKLYVPKGKKTVYQESEWGKYFKNILELEE